MDEISPHLYISRGLQQGVELETLKRASAARSSLIARQQYPILSLGHLARVCGVSHQYLRKIVERGEDPYTDIAIPKRSGGLRAISSPDPVLMQVQRTILRNVLPGLPIHGSSFAYQQGRSIVQCAKMHIGASWLIKLDLHDFFGSISEERIYSDIRQLGYSRLVSFELARISTRFKGRVDYSVPGFEKYYSIRSYVAKGRGVLPQGAPTSGYLANASAFSLDSKLSDLASKEGLVYTRYSDDLTFSAGPDFDRESARKVIRDVRALVVSERHRLHERKTRVVPPGARHVVLGLLVLEDCVRLLPELRRRIAAHVRGVGQFGLVEHCAHRGFDSVISFVNHIDGMIAFAGDIEPTFAEVMRSSWNAAGTMPWAGWPDGCTRTGGTARWPNRNPSS